MKKFLLSIIISSLVLIGYNTTFASDCKEVEFSNGRVCVDITKESNSTFQLDTNIEKGSSSLRCAILLADNSYKEVDCNGTFTVSKRTEQMIKFFIKMGGTIPTDWDGKPSDSAVWNFPQWMYDFSDGEWSDSSSSNNNNNNSSSDEVDNFYVTSDSSYPSTNQRVDLNIKARDNDNSTVTDYTDDVDFKVYYRTSSSSSWTLTTNSSYFELDSDYDDGYDFTSSDDGYATLTDAIRFKKDYDFKVRVVDASDSSIYGEKIFYSDEDNNDDDDSSSSDEVDNFYVTSDNSYPSINQRVDLNIKARDNDNSTVTDYTDDVDFKVYYRTSSSSSWTLTTNSSYFELDSDYDDGYDFTSSDDGYATLTDAIRFKKDYDFKVRVVDASDSSIYGEKIFYSDEDNNDDDDSSSSDEVDNFYITSDNSYPSINQRIDLNIKARDNNNSTVTDYTDDVDFKVYYRTSSSSSWTLTTNSSYFELDSDYDDGYDFTSSDDGYATLTDAIRFKKDYDFKVRIVDASDSSIYGEKIFYSDEDNNNDNNSSDEVDNFYVTSDNSYPSINQRVDLNIKARDNDNSTVIDYTDDVDFKVYYRTSSSSSWTLTTNSSYFEIDSDYDDGYDFTSSDDGYATLTDAIRFKKSYDFKVRVVDASDSSIYGEKTFYTDEDSSDDSSEDIDNFYITSDNSYPDVNQRVDLAIKARDNDNFTVTDYTDDVDFKVYYRTSSSSSWALTTNSSYFEIDSDYDDGYDFTSSDDGYVTLTDAIRFKKDYDFKVRVVDASDSSIYGEKTFYIGDDDSSVDGFTSSELADVQSKYDSRDKTISAWKTSYSKLRTNQTWVDKSDNLKTEMRKILNDSSNKEYETYNEFMNAIEDRYEYTIANK